MTETPLTEREVRLLGECLKAAAEGPFFPDWEFDTLFGLSRREVAEVADRWPDVNWAKETVQMAVHHSLLHLTGYPHGEEEAWDRFVSASSEEIVSLIPRWRRAQEVAQAGEHLRLSVDDGRP